MFLCLYVGKGGGGDNGIDFKSGAAAVVRNLSAAFTPESRHNWHVVVVDRFYSSVLLAVELLKMNVYVVGTIQINRLGFNKALPSMHKTRPASIPRGSFLFSRSAAVATMIPCLWWDRKPVYHLCTGSVMTASTIERKIQRVGALQALFLEFLDLALVNASLSHKETAKIKGTVSMPRAEWFAVLQNELLQLKAENFAGVQATPPASCHKRRRTPVRLTHALQQAEDWVTVSGVQKRRNMLCKDWALLRTEKKKSYATTYFCERCSIDDAMCWLCNKIHRDVKGVPKTCFEIWHENFGAGQDIPAKLGKRVVLRRPVQDSGKRKQTRRELQLRHAGGNEGEGGDDGDNEGSGDG
ncbi:unnamed protein product [Phytophthora fragariaefolia]|uniref:Unnamed protein product n=1 Tax=Phytophthora fragariaefolia TaxID=1490495 RepID=A0A9W6YR23_9STRA|nr:unnamed protein product [Phytophthora fragariaefolia]